jgi:HrpA-like RNA helicase
MLPVDPKLGKMLIMGAVFRCIDPILTVVAGLSVRDPFLLPQEKKDVSLLISTIGVYISDCALVANQNFLFKKLYYEKVMDILVLKKNACGAFFSQEAYLHEDKKGCFSYYMLYISWQEQQNLDSQQRIIVIIWPSFGLMKDGRMQREKGLLMNTAGEISFLLKHYKPFTHFGSNSAIF